MEQQSRPASFDTFEQIIPLPAASSRLHAALVPVWLNEKEPGGIVTDYREGKCQNVC